MEGGKRRGMFDVERDPRTVISLFLMPCREKAKVFFFFFKHIKFEILMIYGERKRERKREGEKRRGGGRGFKHDANHLEWGAEVASTACSV